MFDIIILAVASAVAVSRAVDLRQMGTLCRSTVYLSDRLCKCLCQRRSASKRFFEIRGIRVTECGIIRLLGAIALYRDPDLF